MKRLSILDPSIVSYNLGNEIIFESISEIVSTELDHYFSTRLQFTDKLGRISKKYVRESDLVLLAGTNSLSSKMSKLEQFKINLFDTLYLNNITLCGVGWWQYQEKPTPFSKFVIKRMLSEAFIHSVRDSYTEQALHSIGITNVLNTSCPSLWKISDDHCHDIPVGKSRSVLFTLTDYNKNPVDDRNILNLLADCYENIYFWPQGIGDLAYLNSINLKNDIKITYLSPNLKSLDSFLASNTTDYIGTRLHSGIRAIQHKKRALIIAIDNRAKEISKDTNINSTLRNDIERINNFINNEYSTRIVLPWKNIEKWKNQFKAC